MRSKIPILIAVFFMCVALNLHAQIITEPTDSFANIQSENVEGEPINPEATLVNQQIPRNFIKLNLTGILLKNYGVQYERVLSKRISVALQYRIMPETGIPHKNFIQKKVGDDDPDTKKTIDDLRMSNFAITPELRIYLSKKGYGRGFYIAPFYRYASFTANGLNVFYTDENDVEQSLKLSGKLTSNTGGLLLGVQSMLAKSVVLDISFFGPHFGVGNGNFTGTSSKTLSPSEQDDLRQELEDIDIPFTDKTVNVNANAASMKLDGPWGGFRFAISLGVRF